MRIFTIASLLLLGAFLPFYAALYKPDAFYVSCFVTMIFGLASLYIAGQGEQ